METITQKPTVTVSHESVVIPPEYINIITKIVIDKIKSEYVLVKKSHLGRDKLMSEKEMLFFIDHIVWHICDYFKVTKEEFYSVRRCRIRGSFFTLSEMRFFAMRMCRSMPFYPMSFQFIGAKLGKDHSAVQHGVKKINGLIDVDENFKKAYEELEGFVKETLL